MSSISQCPLCSGRLSPVFRGTDFFCTACVAAVCPDDEVTYVFNLRTEETHVLETAALLAAEQAAYTPAGGGPALSSVPLAGGSVGS